MPDIMTQKQHVHAALAQSTDRTWFRVDNRAAGKATVYLYDEIGLGGKTAKDFANEVNALDVDSIEFHVHSPGGDVFDGLAILNALRNHKARVTTVVDGLAASAASFVAMAGDEIIMSPNSEFMIHDARGLALGTAKDMAYLADVLDKQSDNIAAIYAAKAGGDVAEWRDRMRAETWYTAQEAVDAGLADRVAELENPSPPVENRFDLSIFNYGGRAKAPAPAIDVIPAATASGSTEQEGQDMGSLMDSLRQKLGITDTSADEATILAALDEALSEHADPPQPQGNTEPKQLQHLAAAAGAVIVDKGVWDEAQAKIQQGVDAARKLREQDRDQLLDKAVEDGRIPAGSREYWANLYDRDPQGTAEVVAKLRKNLVPVEALGYAGSGDDSDDLGEFAALFPKER